MDSARVISTSKLSKYFGKSRGIIDVSLSVEYGEIYGFIGPNGAGKSTTIRTLLGLIRPTSGSATIFGKDITKFGPQIHEEIGYLPSEVFYYDNMKVIDLLHYSASFYKKDQSVISKRIATLASLLDLDVTKKIDDLSYGNKKKVGIIQGIAHSPKLLILDEPTGGLDPLIQQKFFDLLREENSNGTTILFSSHNLSEVQRLCNRVAIIKEGKIITVEKISNLMDNTYKKIRLETIAPLKPTAFKALKGISDLHIEGTSINFLYGGNINDVVSLIAHHKLHNVQIEEPDLEEIFIHYYKD